MSQKLPVSDLLNESFSFGVQRFWTVVRCLLVPYLVLIVGMIGVMLALLDLTVIQEMETSESYPGAPLELLDAVFRIAWPSAIAITMLAVLILSLPLYGGMTSLYRLVGLGEEPGGWLTIRLDGPAWRVILATIIMFVLQLVVNAIGFGIAMALNTGLIGAIEAMEGGGDPPVGLIVSFFFQGFLITLVLMMLIFTRLAPFVAATACENRLMLISAWHMTKGHFWTILGSFILMVLGLIVLQIGFELVSSLIQVMVDALANIGGGVFGILSIIVGIGLFVASMALTFFVTGVQSAFPSIIYRRLWLEEGQGSGGARADADEA